MQRTGNQLKVASFRKASERSPEKDRALFVHDQVQHMFHNFLME